VAIIVALTGYDTVSVIQIITAKTNIPSIRCPAVVRSAGVGIINIPAIARKPISRPYFLNIDDIETG
jgi:hypothetical protein